jgi:hypothetical protein
MAYVMPTKNVFTVEYRWYEGEHDSTLVSTDMSQGDFDHAIKTIAGTLISPYLPDAYEQIITRLVKNYNCEVVNLDKNTKYFIEDEYINNNLNKYYVTKKVTTIQCVELKND